MASFEPFFSFFSRLVFVLLASNFFVSSALSQTLEAVKQRGHLICAASQPMSGFAQKSNEGYWSGFDVDFCRAISVAIFSDPNKVEFKPYSGLARFAPLQTGDVDVFVRNAPWNLTRDTSYQVRYVGTSFFDGQAFLTKKQLGIVSSYELENVRVCVMGGGDDQRNLVEFFFKNQTNYEEVIYEERGDLAIAYQAGLCDTVTAPASWLYSILRSLPDSSSHQILPERISKQPLGPVVRNGDDEWFDIIQWVLFALLNAEELGINSLSVTSLEDVKTPAIRRFLGFESDFGEPLGLEKDWMQKMIEEVGNYEEIYERSFGPQTGANLPRGINALWTQGGLLFAPPIR